MIDGEQINEKEPPTITEAMLKQYLFYRQEYKRLGDELDQMRELLAATGTFCTENYVCAVTVQERTGVKPLAHLDKVFGRDFLNECEMLQTVQYKVVRVTKKVEDILA